MQIDDVRYRMHHGHGTPALAGKNQIADRKNGK